MTRLRVSLEQWQSLIAVVDSGSYTRAAERLSKSQSSITYAIQQLEAVLGVAVFELHGRKAQLTDAGRMLTLQARGLVADAAGIEMAARTAGIGWEAQICVAVEILFAPQIMLGCLARLANDCPHTSVELIESVLAGTGEALVSGQAQLAITAQIPQGFTGDPLMRFRMIAVAHRDHELHRLGRPITLRDLRHARQIVIRETAKSRPTSHLTVDGSPRWTVSNFATAVEAITLGYGFCWMAEDRIGPQLATGLIEPLHLREGSERFGQLYLVFSDRDRAGPATERLAALIREAVHDRASQTSRPNPDGNDRSEPDASR